MASIGSISPNSTTSGFSGVTHAGHSGAPPAASSISTTRSSSTRVPHTGHRLHSIEPCTSTTCSLPAARCSRSMFWVITPSISPRRSSSATAAWAGLGWTSRSEAKRAP